MNHKNTALGLAMGMLAALAVPAANAATVAVNGHVGTLGGGLDIAMPIVTNKLDARVGFSAFQKSVSRTESNVEYDASIKLSTFGAVMDWYPFSGTFRLTAGVYHDGNKFDLTGKPTSSGTYTINGTTYTAAQVGTLNGEMAFRSMAPYIGIGWGNEFRGGHWTFMGDIGALYQGSPKVTLSASGAASNPTLANDIAAQQQKTQNDVAGYKWWPLLQMGVAYRF